MRKLRSKWTQIALCEVISRFHLPIVVAMSFRGWAHRNRTGERLSPARPAAPLFSRRQVSVLRSASAAGRRRENHLLAVAGETPKCRAAALWPTAWQALTSSWRPASPSRALRWVFIRVLLGCELDTHSLSADPGSPFGLSPGPAGPGLNRLSGVHNVSGHVT